MFTITGFYMSGNETFRTRDGWKAWEMACIFSAETYEPAFVEYKRLIKQFPQ